MGRTAEAQSLADSLAARLRAGEFQILHQYADMAAFHARQADAEGALAWLAESVKLSPMLHYWHLSSGLFDRVRERPGFAESVTRMEEEIRIRLAEQRAALGGRLE
jgi:hypothetical protein